MTDHPEKETDHLSGVETTGHEWDGLKELNNPAPRWWLWVFFLCVIWSIGYWIVYPAWPTLSGNTKGAIGWTEYTKLSADQAEITALRGKMAHAISKKPLAAIESDPTLYAFALAGGKAMFKENCAACHGTGAAGGNGYPNLNDDDWLWGGDVQAIYTTLRYGIRSGHEKARFSMMPAFADLLSREDVTQVSRQVRSLSGLSSASERGAALFAKNCASCHGEDGKGMRQVGAPNLTDAIWLYGSSAADIENQIRHPKGGVMPAWITRLDDATLKQLAIYVHSLGGGEAAPDHPDTPTPEPQ